MGVKVVLLVALFCVLQCEVRSHEFLKSAYNSVKNAVVKGYHSVAHVFMKHDHDDDHEHSEDCGHEHPEDFDYEHADFNHEHPDFNHEHPHFNHEHPDFDLDKDEKIQKEVLTTTIQEEILTTTIQPIIDVRFKENEKLKEEQESSSLNRRDALNDDVPDINNRFLINAPCGEGTRRKGVMCRQVIYK